MDKTSLTEIDRNYAVSLAKQYPTIDAAVTEIINLRAILGLPKGTEHFVSDIHGEYESFLHVLKTASGVIRKKIDLAFENLLTDSEKRTLAMLIYYPEQKLEEFNIKGILNNSWYQATLYRLIKVCRLVTCKYTRSKVRKSLPKNFDYIIEELINEDGKTPDKKGYCDEIVETIISTGMAHEFIIAISNLIQNMAIDRLHILGDIFDRGPGADIIIDKLMTHHALDVQWGNHDILWMGAGSGSLACIAIALRISLKYGNISLLREGYGIDISPLTVFAMETYANDPCTQFMPSLNDNASTEKELLLIAKMHKAITVIEAKLTAQAILRHPEYNMSERTLLDKLDLARGIIVINGVEWPLNDLNLPTINPEDQCSLSAEEQLVMQRLERTFVNCDKLQKHLRFLFEKGSMYLCYNNNLLFHGCIPLNTDGDFQEFTLNNEKVKGKSLLDWCDTTVRLGFFSKNYEERALGQDTMWFLWTGKDSPLFGKKQMTTFERYFISDKKAHIEEKNSYYHFRDTKSTCENILTEFNLNASTGHIINGHVPVKVAKGESPIKAGGKLLVIDGGFAKAYQKETGIAGYTLIFSSRGMMIAAHRPFESTKKAIEEELDVFPESFVVSRDMEQTRIRNTDVGKGLLIQIKNLNNLIMAYKQGIVRN